MNFVLMLFHPVTGLHGDVSDRRLCGGDSHKNGREKIQFKSFRKGK
jgi:hypothetical protein